MCPLFYCNSDFYVRQSPTSLQLACLSVSVRLSNITRLCFVEYVPNHTRGIYPGYYPANNFCKLCRAFIPMPGTSVSYVRHHTRTRNFCKFCTPMPQIPGLRVQHFLYPPGTSVSSVRPCHNPRDFCEFCNTSIPVPKTSGSSVRLPYPYPESTNPAEHTLEIIRSI